jgi:phage shock protein PspC (stress-responsive transcriptional regulator)
VEEFKLDNENRLIGGVCAGLANYLNTDVTFIRLITVALGVIHPVAWMFYCLLWLIAPENNN